MSESLIRVIANRSWESTQIPPPRISVITAAYNRRATVRRTIASVLAQTFRDIEYILVDDGSDEPLDDIAEELMAREELPVLYIRKPNGGVHTARNAAIRYARSPFFINVDSDDELLPHACQTYMDAWSCIPEDTRAEYYSILALNRNQDGDLTSGVPFPDDFNEYSKEEVERFNRQTGDLAGCYRTDILKANPFPEPEGVAYVTENSLWSRLNIRYRSWGVNRVVCLVHTEGSDRLSGQTHRSVTAQGFRNRWWNTVDRLNHPDIFPMSYKQYLKDILVIDILQRLLRKQDPAFLKRFPLRGGWFWRIVFWLPAIPGAWLYIKTA